MKAVTRCPQRGPGWWAGAPRPQDETCSCTCRCRAPARHLRARCDRWNSGRCTSSLRAVRSWTNILVRKQNIAAVRDVLARVRVRQIAFRCVVRAISLRHGLQQSHDLRFLRSCVCLKRGTNRSPPDRIPRRATLRTGFIVRRRLPQHLNGNGAMAIVGDAAHTALHAERVGAPDDRSTR
jgi:hypothetical protein